MKPKPTKKKPTNEPGVKMDIKGAIDEANRKAKSAPIMERINGLKDRARKEGVAFTPDLEKTLLACKTMGEIKRAWKAHRQLAPQ